MCCSVFLVTVNQSGSGVKVSNPGNRSKVVPSGSVDIKCRKNVQAAAPRALGRSYTPLFCILTTVTTTDEPLVGLAKAREFRSLTQ